MAPERTTPARSRTIATPAANTQASQPRTAEAAKATNPDAAARANAPATARANAPKGADAQGRAASTQSTGTFTPSDVAPHSNRGARPNAQNVAPSNAREGQGQARRPDLRSGGGIKVMALKMVYYDDKRRRAGDVFTIRDDSEFSDKSMEKVDPSTPERITTGAQVLKQQHDQIAHDKLVDQGRIGGPVARAVGATSAPTGDQHAIGDDGDN